MPDTVTKCAPETSAAESAPAPPRDGLSVALTVRYQVRPVLWGSRPRYEVQDILTGITLAIRTTLSVGEADVIVLNMGGRSGLRPKSGHLARAADSAGAPPTEISGGHHKDKG